MNDELKTLRRLEPSRNPPDGADAREQEACEEPGCDGDGLIEVKTGTGDDYVMRCSRCNPSKRQCTCGYVLRAGVSQWETCPQHTPPEPEGV